MAEGDKRDALPHVGPRGDGQRPTGYWVVKALLGVAIAVLAGIDLFAEKSVSPYVFAILGGLAGGPEFVQFIKRGIVP